MICRFFEGCKSNIDAMFNNLRPAVQGAIMSIMANENNVPEEARLKKFIQSAIEVYNIALADKQFAESKSLSESYNLLIEMTRHQALFDSDLLIDPQKYSIFALRLAAMFNTMSKNSLRDTFNEYSDKILGIASSDLFAEENSAEPMSVAGAIKAVFGVDINNNNNNNENDTEHTGGDVPSNDAGESQEGERGSNEDDRGGEQSSEGIESTDDRGGTEGADSEGQSQEERVSEERKTTPVDRTKLGGTPVRAYNVNGNVEDAIVELEKFKEEYADRFPEVVRLVVDESRAKLKGVSNSGNTLRG